MKLYILDVSGYIFRAYYALPHMVSPEGDVVHGLFGFIRSVLKLFKEHGPEHIVAVYDGPDNKRSRQEIYEEYKANRIRDIEDLPDQIELSKTFCSLLGIPHLEVPGVEADDTIGTLAKWAAAHGAEALMCTSDKDLCQLVGGKIFVLNPWKDYLRIDSGKVEELYGVPPEKMVDLLAIMGDSSDNIPGLYGFGPKTAAALLQEFGSLEAILAHPEKVKGKKKQETLMNEADTARLSQRLATIHTDVPIPKSAEMFPKQPADIPGLREFYLQYGFNSLVKELDALYTHTADEKETRYHLVDTQEELDALVSMLSKQSEICFDVETTSIRPMEASLVGVGFCIKEAEAYYVPCLGSLNKATVIESLRPLFENPQIGFFAHNAKYDLHVLANEGLRVAHLSYDTILASYLLHPGGRRHSLDALTLHYFGKVKTPIKSLIGTGKKEITIDQAPIEKVSDYCCEDVDYTWRLKELLSKELDKRGLTSLLIDLELPLTLVLAKMERSGVYLDATRLQEMAIQVVKDIAAVEEEIYALAGETFNISSPKQLSQILFEKLEIPPVKKTATGLSTRAEVLETLALEYPIAAKILEFRTLEKLRSTYLETLPKEIHPVSGRIHPSFLQFVAATGRLACQDPNLQNIPVRTPQGRKVRAAFHPQQRGWSYLSADYSQIELRLLAHLSGDPKLIQAFKAGEDIHAYTAALVFDIPLEKVTKKERHAAKAINFGIIYGLGAYGLSQQIGTSVKEAGAFIEAYFERYPKVMAYIAHSIETARDTGYTNTMIGRQRELPEITSKNAVVRSAAERLAMNTPLQGTAADLIKLAMLAIDGELMAQNFESFMILQIHDELIFEGPDDEMERLGSLVKETMEGIFSLKVPLVVDLHVGKNWAEC